MFKKVLVANRGLVAANCVRAVRELGAKAAITYETSDLGSAAVRAAETMPNVVAAAAVFATTSTTEPSSALRNATLSRPPTPVVEATRSAPGRTKRLKCASA